MARTPKQFAPKITVLPWVAFSSAIAIWALIPLFLTDYDAAIFLVPLPALLLVVGGLRRSGGGPSYVRACIALGVLMDLMLLLLVLPAPLPLALPRAVEMVIFGMWFAHAPTAIGAGVVAAVYAIQGRSGPTVGIAGVAVSAIAGLTAASIVWQLARFTSP